MRRTRFHSLICLWAAATTAVGGCRRPAVTPKTPAGTIATPGTAATPASIAGGGRPTVKLDPSADSARLAISLPDPNALPATPVTATALDDAATAQLLARLEPLPDLAAVNAHAPTVRPASLPPPRSGPVEPIAFVVPVGKPAGAIPPAPVQPKPIHPLAAPEILPKDEVRAEANVRVRFAEPMVAVAKVGDAPRPLASISPAVPGTWRWLDTRVLAFEASGPRFPQATTFTVTVPAGVTAVSGAKLAEPAVGMFTTPPIQITRAFPNEIRPDGAVAIGFDQPFDAASITKLLTIKGVKGPPIKFRVLDRAAAEARWQKDPGFAFTFAELEKRIGKHYLLIGPATVWPAGLEAHVALGAGAPSAEGPLVSRHISRTDFQIVPPFTVRGFACGYGEQPRMSTTCPANNYGRVVFANAIDPQAFRSSMVQLEGQRFADHQASGADVGISTPRIVGRTFAIRIADGLVDTHGQPLVGPRRPTFTTTREVFEASVEAPAGLMVLDPRFEIPQWVLRTEAIPSLRVQLYKVTPADYFAFEQYEAGERATPPGTRVFDRAYPVGLRGGMDLRVDLRPALAKDGLGHVVAIATVDGKKQFNHTAWMQVTKLAVTARLDKEHVSGWVQDISPDRFLTPRTGATAQILVEGRKPPQPVRADASGHVAFELPPPPATSSKVQPSALLAITDGTDSAFTAISRFEKAERKHQVRWYVTDDRFTYKPGEKVYVKGWVRWTHDGPNPDLALPAAGEAVRWQLTDARGNKLGNGTAPLSEDGGFDLEAVLPAAVNLGNATFTFTARNATQRHPIAIQEFRTPAYAVTLDDDVTHSGATPLIVGESVEMHATAAYYAGGGLGGSPISWQAKLATTSYRPPNWNLYTFAPPRMRSNLDDYYDANRRTIEKYESTNLSAGSASTAVFELSALHANQPSVLTVDATVTDVDRQRIRATSRPILVHPSSYYVGIRKRPGTATALDVIVTDIDGEPVAGVPVEVTLEGVLGSERFRDDAKVVDTQTCKLVSAATPVACTYTHDDPTTSYLALAAVTDARGRTNRAQYQIPWWKHEERKRDFWLTADQPSYKPGDVARIEIHSTLLPASAVVTFARQGIITEQRVELVKESTFVEVPIEEAYMTNLHVAVDRVTKRPRTSPADPRPLPAQESAQLDLPVDLESARLVMKARALAPIIEPGANTTFEIEVRHGDKPKANAEVALIVVDEAVLALADKDHVDPLPGFYRKVGAGLELVTTVNMVRDAGPDLKGKPGADRYRLDDVTSGMGGYGVGGGRGGFSSRVAASPSVRMGAMSVVKSREDFRANAVFSPRLRTDAKGKARVSIKMPDSLTRFRVVALGTANTRYFGKAESTVVTQRRLNARTQAPRFLTQGDTFSLPVVVQNLDTAPRTVDVAVRAANLTASGPMGKRISIAGGQRAEVRFDFATGARGKAAIQTIVQSGTFADASKIELPVYAPATTESFATYGIVDGAAAYEQLTIPSAIYPDVGGVEVEMSSTQLQALTDAYWYLFAYPYECAEQRSSRMLATSAIFDVLEAFSTPGRPSKQDIEAQRELDLKKLAAQQNRDGGFGYFRGMDSDPFVSMQVLMALAAIQAKGTMIANVTGYVTTKLAALTTAIDKDVASPPTQARRDRLPYDLTLAATALGALAKAGTDVTARAQRLHAAATALRIYPVEAKARLLALLAGNARAKDVRSKLLAQLVSATQETASAATVTTAYVEAERLLLVSNARTTALALDALIREAPEHPLIAKLARGLLDGRTRGRWRSTQENVVVLQAMRRYFDTYEKVTPNFMGKLWLGKAGYAEQPFVGRSTARAQTHAAWTTLGPGSTHDVAVVKDGPGRLYYRVGITYAPTQVDLPALDAGFIVRRTFTPIDAPSDVTKLADGRIRVKLGARVLVSIEMLNTTVRHAVAVVDPMPAGFEAVNTALATSERPAAVQEDTRWDFQNLRDERTEAFAMRLAEGTHRFSYTARATTPGTFIAAPAKAEEMYSPETFGRSTGVTVVIE